MEDELVAQRGVVIIPRSQNKRVAAVELKVSPNPHAYLTVCLLFCTELEAKDRKRFLFISALLGLKLGTSVQCGTMIIPGCLGWTGP